MNPEYRKLKNARALLTTAGDEGRVVDERVVGSFMDIIAEGCDEIKSGKTKPKHLIFSALCLLLVLFFTWWDIILLHIGN